MRSIGDPSFIEITSEVKGLIETEGLRKGDVEACVDSGSRTYNS